jgi:glucosylceramidase
MLQSSYFYIGHFARFIRPGARRVLCASTRQVLEATAFVNPDGTLAVVVMNRSEAPQAFALRTGSGFHHAELPARSIATYLSAGTAG